MSDRALSNGKPTSMHVIVFLTTVLPILPDPQSLEALPVQAPNRVLSLRKLGSGEPRPALGDSDSCGAL